MAPEGDLAWSRTRPAVAARLLLVRGVLGPLMDRYARRTVRGSEHLRAVDGPVLLVATHASHMDAPTILRSLPPALARRTAVAAAADYFYARPALAATVALAFGTVPVRRDGDAAASTLDALIDAGWSLVVFAEGTRSRSGAVGRLHTGAAVLAAAHAIPIVPVLVTGTHAVMPPGRSWMRRPSRGRRGEVVVRFGPPVRPAPDEHRTAVMERVRRFYAAAGAETTLDKRIAAERRRAVAG